ncbi:hypothetical protein ARMGADRAFT_1084845 [Armillaria gallica]|uniref:Retrotransposon gag domain-containing protein n=1 Tax=Armillaria gallica TaxID=47427 RepID=A0A2H3D375_ARMGA|nr:hypothetical protein ARMGADRAFT_1084845 [Armillaria gallica]
MPLRYVLPQFPTPPLLPDPPVPWQLVDGAIAPYNNFKPKIIKEVDNFKDDAEKWWELNMQIIGKDQATVVQLYPTYKDFKTELSKRFWKDADVQLKYAQWEKLRQLDFKDGDQFFQKFEELAYHTQVHDNDQVMLHQIKKAACQTSKNTIYSADGEMPTDYDGWKAHLLQIDYNWHLKQEEGTTMVPS